MKDEFIEHEEALIFLKSIFGTDVVTKVEINKEDSGYFDKIENGCIEFTAMNLVVTFFNGNIVRIGTSEWGWIEKYEKTN